MTLDYCLVSNLGIPDVLSARILIRDGFVTVNGQTITRHDFPVSTHDTVVVKDERLAKIPAGYFRLMELQKNSKMFNSKANALCIGVDSGTLSCLNELHAPATFAGPSPSGVPGISDVPVDPLAENVAEKNNGKFALIILGPKFGLFTAFNILRKNSGSLTRHGRALIDAGEKETFSSASLDEYAENAGFYIDAKIQFELEPSCGWLIMKKKNDEQIMDSLAFFVLLSAIEFVAVVYLARKLWGLASRKQSLSTTYGKIFEQTVPFSREFPFEPKLFRFIGDPIDGVAFTDDAVVFCEIKLNNSALSERQKRIKALVQQKKVEWREIRGKNR